MEITNIEWVPCPPEANGGSWFYDTRDPMLLLAEDGKIHVRSDDVTIVRWVREGGYVSSTTPNASVPGWRGESGGCGCCSRTIPARFTHYCPLEFA